LGERRRIQAKAHELHLHLNGIQITDPRNSPRKETFIEEFYSPRQRKGVTRTEAAQTVLNRVTFGSLMVRLSDADALIGGLTTHHPDTIQVMDLRPELGGVAGGYVIITPKSDIFFLADADGEH
jgi:malate dehydrogenase (oxaloacetate-decarboxylating)(NADP+)